QLRVLMAAVAEGHHEDVGRPQAATARVEEGAGRTEIDLSFLSRGGVDADHRLVGGWAKMADEAAGRGKDSGGTPLPVPAEDGHHFDVLRQELLDDRLVGPDRGWRTWKDWGWPEKSVESGDVRQFARGIEMAGRLGQLPVLAHRLAGNMQVLRDPPLALAK